MDQEKIKKLFEDEAFVKELMALETPEEVQALLEEQDVEVSVEEIQQIRDFLKEHEGEELTEEELENVAGGFGLIILICILVGAVVTGGLITENFARRRW